MTHSDKAREILRSHSFGDDWTLLLADIAAALREAETAAYEKAAQVADRKLEEAVANRKRATHDISVSGFVIEGSHQARENAASEIATAIRALKTESNPQQ